MFYIFGSVVDERILNFFRARLINIRICVFYAYTFGGKDICTYVSAVCYMLYNRWNAYNLLSFIIFCLAVAYSYYIPFNSTQLRKLLIFFVHKVSAGNLF